MGLIILFALLSTTTFAQILEQAECTPTDIRATNPKIQSNPEMVKFFSTPRDQGSIGWCYAFASADLLSAEIGQPVSGMHAAIINNVSQKKKITASLGIGRGNKSFDEVYEAGVPKDTINEIVKNGYICSEKDLPYDSAYTDQVYHLIKALENFKSYDMNEAQLCHQMEFFVDTHDLSIDAKVIAKSLMEDNLNQTLEKISIQQCKNKMLPVPKLTTKTTLVPKVGKKSAKNFLGDTNAILDQGKPIEITYNIKHYLYEGMKGWHSSVLIGRRWHKGVCQYQIRNSWGQSCELYNSKVECDLRSGTFWVNDELFVKATTHTRHIPNR